MSAKSAQTIRFLASGNVYFSSHCAVLNLPDKTAPVSSGDFEAAVAWVKDHFQIDEDLSGSGEVSACQEPSTFVGQVSRLAEIVQKLAGFYGAAVPGWLEVSSDETVAAFACADQATGQAAAALAINILTGMPGSDRDKLAKRLQQALRPWTTPLAKAASARGIPISVVAASERPFLALGHGAKRRIFWKNFTPDTSIIATTLSTRKDMTSRLLREAGLPAPRNVVVSDSQSAVRAAESFGYPVVVKPAATDFGRGVVTDNYNANQVRKAYELAAKYGPVLLEQQITGATHRLLVVHGRCTRVSKFMPASVIGNGLSTVLELVESTNETRTDHLSARGVKIKLDQEALEILNRQGLSLSSVPSKDSIVLLRGNVNRLTGGTAEVVTEIAHPDVCRMAVQTASVLGIDVAGIDYVTSDISLSPKETGGAICEVNVNPGLLDVDEVTRSLIDPFFPRECNGRIPTVGIVTKANQDKIIKNGLLALMGPNVSCSDDVQFWGEDKGAALPRRTQAVMADPLASAALISCSTQEFQMFGLGTDRCTLAVLEKGVPKDIVAALLRISINVIMPASLYQEMAKEPLVTARMGNIWIAGETAEFVAADFAGWTRQVAPDKIEISTRLGSTWSIVHAVASEDAEIMVAAGAALAAPMNRISQSLRLL